MTIETEDDVDVAALKRSLAAAAVAASLALACFGGIAWAAAPAPLPGGVTLGMTVAELRQSQAAPRRVARPVRMTGGLVGSWTADPVDVAGVALAPTFFLAAGQLQRVEYLAGPGDAAAFAALLEWGRQAWGPELATSGPEGAYASWSTDAIDAYLQLAAGSGGPRARLVVRQRVLKDAGEL